MKTQIQKVVKRQNKHAGWIVALALTCSLTMASSAFADSWGSWSDGDSEIEGINITAQHLAIFREGTVAVQLSSFPAGISETACSGRPRLVFIKDVGESGGKEMIAAVMAARSLNRPIDIVHIGAPGSSNFCKVTRVEF